MARNALLSVIVEAQPKSPWLYVSNRHNNLGKIELDGWNGWRVVPADGRDEHVTLSFREAIEYLKGTHHD